MKSCYVFLCLAAVVYFSSAQSIFKACESKIGTVKNVVIPGCSQTPCTVKKGKSYTINVTFTANKASDQAWSIVHGIVAGVPVPYAIPNPNGCVNSGLLCPLRAGQTYKYSATLPILSIYPDIKVVVKWELADTKGGGEDLFCFETLIQVVG